MWCNFMITDKRDHTDRHCQSPSEFMRAEMAAANIKIAQNIDAFRTIITDLINTK